MRTIIINFVLILFCVSLSFTQWGPDVRLTYDNNDSYTSFNNARNIAIWSSSVHVLWVDTRDGNDEIYYKGSTDEGTTWQTDTRLTNDMGFSIFPSAGATSSNVHVIWDDDRTGVDEIFWTTSTDGGTNWRPDTMISSGAQGPHNPSLTTSGTFIHTVWDDFRDTDWEIYFKRTTDNGITWDPDIRLTTTGGNSWYPSIAASGLNLHLVWTDDRDGNNEIYYKNSTDGGENWSLDDTRLTNDAGNSLIPCVATRGSNVHVVWWDDRTGNDEIYYKRSTDGGTTWGQDTRLTNNAGGSILPNVAVWTSNIHLVWSDSSDGNWEIYYKRSTDQGETWGPDTRLTTDAGNSLFPSVTVWGTKVHLVWTDDRDGNQEIYYKNGIPLGVEENQIANLEFRNAKLKIKPNPFISFATIPGHEKWQFSVYDISGRVVGIYRGDRIGEDLSAGVYFIKPNPKSQILNSKLLRIVKVK